MWWGAVLPVSEAKNKIHHIQNVFQGCIESNGGWEKYEHITVSQIPR